MNTEGAGMTPHELSLLKEYMQDLIEQARQESFTLKQAGYREQDYGPEQALMDLLALLDDRIESEGVQIGLSEEFPHRMGEICQRAQVYIKDSVWLAKGLTRSSLTKDRVRAIAYKALLDYIKDETG
jgi:hypothetical protein